ncbi:hypothetical protein, partial [Rhizobium leguminosarum]|uniref:hypothetical protein n=1 Tax=Rhizobium leguminosarum TaxID=384 RepID=UPI001C988D2E
MSFDRAAAAFRMGLIVHRIIETGRDCLNPLAGELLHMPAALGMCLIMHHVLINGGEPLSGQSPSRLRPRCDLSTTSQAADASTPTTTAAAAMRLAVHRVLKTPR